MGNRLALQDTGRDIVMKLCEGNPGAINVMMSLLSVGHIIDPDNGLGGIGTLLWFDTDDIVGPKIWVLFKDIGQSSVRNVVMLGRAIQLGFMPSEELQVAIAAHHLDEERFWELNGQVEERLPQFQKLVREISSGV